MNRPRLRIAVSLVFLLCGCAVSEPPVEVAKVVELPPPFSSEQIREAWTAGLRLIVERREGDAQPVIERWTVLESGADQATIEFATIDAAGGLVGEAAVAVSSWDELRDHARFAPGSAVRERVTRESELGSLHGWLYTVQEEAGVVSEYFFAEEFPGAPVAMVSRRRDQTIAALRQIRREHIDQP